MKMKKKLSIILLIGFFSVFFSIIPAMAAPIATLNLLGTGDIQVGETFSVEVWAGDDLGQPIAEELLSFGFDVSVDDGSVFSYDGYTIESGFDDDSWGANNVTGSVFPGIADDDVLLATLSFTALTDGTNTLNTVGLYDGGFSGLYYEDLDMLPYGFDINSSRDITVGSTPVPEPATMFLLSLGILGLAGVNRKRFKK